LARRIKSLIRNTLPVGRLSYSQEGEDLVLARLFGARKNPGFYVDIGAHHPVRYSNSYYFYRRGWRGISVDAMPGTARLFRRMRPRDIVVECGVGAEEGTLTYYVFNEPALNTFSKAEAEKKNGGDYRILDKIQIPVITLPQLLSRHLPVDTVIDFMTIDTEGLDYEVIASNDWNRYRPAVILIELLNTRLEDLANNPSASLLARHGYRAFAKTCNTFFFVNDAMIGHWNSTTD
jgi:FkbM family methyltransferase